MLKIWGRRNSVNVQKAMWCIGELGLAHERIDAGMQFGVNKEDWYLALNPNGLVPLIDDEGFNLWESNAIVRYLAAKYDSGGLCPGDLQTRALADSWMDWQISVLSAPLTVVFWQLVRTPEAQRDRALVKAQAQKTADVLAVLDRHLAGKQYIAGDNFSIGDIPVGAMTHRWYALAVEHPDYPNLRAWYERLSARPAYQEHVMLPLS